MRKILLSLLLFFAAANALISQTIYREYLDGKIYVKFSKAAVKSIAKEDPRNVPLEKFTLVNRLFAKYNVTRISFPFYQASDDAVLPAIMKFEFGKASLVTEFMKELEQIAGVEYTEKVRLNKTDAVPNDPLFATANGSTHLNQINAQNAWNIFNGTSTVVVAIVDNAIMNTHVDLTNNIYTNQAELSGTTGVDDDGNGYVDDIHGFDVAGYDAVTSPTAMSQDHGTHCSGIAGGSTDNSTGIASIGWNLKILPVKSSYDNSSSLLVDLGYEGIIYAVRSKAKIISCSWGNSGALSITEQSVIDYAWNRGCIIFASAGNLSSSTPNYPGAYNHVFCVAAVNTNDVKSSYSNYGPWVDICAPGDNILSTVPYVSTPAYISYSGTSMATPLVAGLAGMMLSKSPYMTRMDVLNCLSSTAVNVYTLSGNASYVTNNQLGVGRIDAFAAMTCASTYTAPAPVANFYAFLPNTCPNTLIPFIDSSLYAPTSWNWTFQGGTPATSTLTNPSVQWSTAGTYSVSLTVSNANGSSSVTRLSYVTVAGPASLPFAEGFQSTTFLPTGWVANNIYNDNIYWQRTSAVGGFGTSTSCAMFNNFTYNAPGERDEMRSPKFDLSNVAMARLRFDVAYARYDAFYSDSLEVKTSANCGTSWTSVYLKGGSTLSTKADQSAFFVPTSTQWRRDTIDVSAQVAGQTNVMFSFLNRGGYGQPVYLDNINLVFPSPTLSAVHASTICAGSTETFSNTSIAAASYTWNFQGGSPAVSTSTNPSITFNTPGTYTVSLYGINGTSDAILTETITVISQPSTSVLSSATGSICSGSAVTLSASGASTYSWSTGSQNSSIVVSPASSSVYTVTGFNGICVSENTVSIDVGPGTISVAINASSLSVCSGQSATLTLSGANSYSLNGNGITNTTLVVNPSITTNYMVTGSNSMCTGKDSLTLNVIPVPANTILTANSSACSDLCNGSLSLTTTGGSGPYTYSLNNSSCSVFPCNNLCEGSYELTTINASGCSASNSFSIGGPAPVQTAVSGTNSSCSGCQDGQLSVTASGGSGTYSYAWAPSGGNAAQASNLAPGCYTVTVTDGVTHCSATSNTCISIGTGISVNNNDPQLLVYPNPAGEYVLIDYHNNTFDCLLYNHLGQLILSENAQKEHCRLSLDTLAKGVYYLAIRNGSETNYRKLLIE